MLRRHFIAKTLAAVTALPALATPAPVTGGDTKMT
jgi:hypothetical protein